jgi:Flp pilus assembly protein TadG
MVRILRVFVPVNSRLQGNTSGQALVEMALILPALLLLVLGIVEFGRAFNAKQAVNDAAREGARHAVVWDETIDQDSVEAVIETALNRAGIPTASATIAFDKTTGWRNVGQMQTVYVGVQYRFSFFGPLVKAMSGSETITLGARVSMRNQPAS